MDVPLTGIMADTKIVEPKQAVKKTKNPIGEVEEFLWEHETANIVIIIEMHSMENGWFIWCGHNSDTYKVCMLWEVRCISCLPNPV